MFAYRNYTLQYFCRMVQYQSESDNALPQNEYLWMALDFMHNKEPEMLNILKNKRYPIIKS